ncbi:DNA polymerase-3 subunit epsilon [Nocardiopsis arvandica]|uniref:DNA polymerase-3 subunit epsilon n=1 Tax=Nocardiopsis sinuspersici TaxID=501010 RepID=A0A7Y9X758_9ACTN|nr:3'-5' exonuclease [Nocardiopsis sinuspersici]NYH50421.1 DNA polymerase-3 subunit epsilon [Nocardiopsis sinuspersici]
MFTQGRLTRGRGTDPRRMLFAVLDVEATGLDPHRGHRICEVAVVRMRGDGTVVDEYATLVNPGRPLAGEEFHGITPAQAADAPAFADIAGDLVAYLSDAVVVAHNLPFEEKFLEAEFRALGMSPSGLPGLCTLQAFRAHLDRYAYSQHQLYQLMTGEWMQGQHHALADARHLARMLSVLVNESPEPLAWAGPGPVTAPQVPRGGRIAPRTSDLRKGREGWLANLAAGLPDMNPSPHPRLQGVAAYRSMLGHALADGKIVGDEAQRLALLATRAGFTRSTVRQVHEQVLLEARARAEADGRVTSTELRELERAAKNLGAGHVIQDLLYVADQEKVRRNGPLKGWRIVPVGEDGSVNAVVDFAVSHGATVGVNVTKTVRLVIAEAGSTDPRARQAREAGFRVVTPAEAWDLLKAAADKAEHGLFDDGTGAMVAAQLRAEQQEERDRSPWQAFWRSRELTDRQYREQFVAPFERRDRMTRGESRADRGPHRITVALPAEARKKSGGCAGAALLFMATGAAATALSQLWPL